MCPSFYPVHNLAGENTTKLSAVRKVNDTSACRACRSHLAPAATKGWHPPSCHRTAGTPSMSLEPTSRPPIPSVDQTCAARYSILDACMHVRPDHPHACPTSPTCTCSPICGLHACVEAAGDYPRMWNTRMCLTIRSGNHHFNKVRVLQVLN